MNKPNDKKLDFVHVELKRDTWISSERNIQNASDAIDVIKDMIKDQDREFFCILNLSTKNQVINASIVSIGTMNASLVSPSEVFRTSIVSGAKNIIAIHNHPSGNIQPSIDDNAVTKRLYEAGQLLNVHLLDHIIVGGEQMYSYRNNAAHIFEDDKTGRVKETSFLAEDFKSQLKRLQKESGFDMKHKHDSLGEFTY